MVNYCRNCGSKIDRVIKFCPKCGCKITFENEFKEERKKVLMENDNSLFRKIFFGILFFLVILGVYIQNYEKLQNIIDMKRSVVDIPQMANSTFNGNESKVNIKWGFVIGDDVIVRSKPSVLGNQLVLLSNNSRVEILDKEICSDNSAAILSMPSLKIFLSNGKDITINRGQALVIKGEVKGKFVCSLNVGGQEISVELPKNNVRLLKGDIWYKVRTETGTIGYIFYEYVKEEN